MYSSALVPWLHWMFNFIGAFLASRPTGWMVYWVDHVRFWGYHARVSFMSEETVELSMLIARISSHPGEMTSCSTNEPMLHVSLSILSATYNKVSQRRASIVILRRRHHFPSSSPYPLLCIFKRGRWMNGEEEVLNGCLAQWHLPRFFARANNPPVQDHCSHWGT